MGAEHSTILTDDRFASSFSDRNPLDLHGPASLPTSPKKDAQSKQFWKEITRSMSLSVNSSSHQPSTTLPPIQTSMDPQPETNFNRHVSTSALAHVDQHRRSIPSRSFSVSAESNRGIVVVNPGPMQRLRTASSLDSLSRHSRQNAPETELRRLRQIPSFAPLRRNSASRSSSPVEVSADKCYIPSLTAMDASKLKALIEEYEACIQRRADGVYQKQTRIIGLQNKVDYEVQRLLGSLQAREKGVIPSPLRRSKQSTSSSPSSPTDAEPVRLAGRKQMDAVVLQTSQISGLIDQCTVVLDNLCGTLHQLNQSLPESKRLNELQLSLPK